MLQHCGRNFQEYDTWYLYDLKKDGETTFEKRYIKLGKCPVCSKEVAEFIETRVSDDSVYSDLKTGKWAVQMAERESGNVEYSALDVKLKSCKITHPKEIRYGENKIVKIGKKILCRQRAVNKWGKKELVKEENVSPKILSIN